MIPWRRTLATLFSALLLAGFLIAPQRGVCQLLQGTIDGRITDPSQAAIAGAKVNVTNQETNLQRDVVTGAQGEYNFASLPPGIYTLTVRAQGFQTFVKTGVVVNANESVRSDAVLSIGQVSESVTVSSQAVTLQADRPDVHSDLTPQALKQLPLPPGRNYQMLLAVVVPGVSQPQSGQSFGANPSRAVGFSVNGASDITNSQRIDGTSSTNFNSPNKPMYSPALEAIENVNVVTNSPDAEQGIAGGAAVNISTKVGTNAIHGSAFEYFSSQQLQAYAWGTDSTQPKPLYHNNQFGGTIGGPIRKEKLFYFVSYQGTYTTLGNTLFAEVPTAAMVSGDLSASPTPIYDPRTGKADGSGRTPFPKNRIPVDPGIQALLNMFPFPAPNQPGTGSLGLSRNYESTGTSDEKLNQYDTKLSWNANSKLSMFARFGLDRFSWNNPQQFGMLGGPGVSPSNTAVGTGSGSIYSGTASATYVFTSRLIADAYYGYTRNNATAEQQLLGQNLGWTLLGIPGLQTSNPREGGLPALEIDGFGGKGTQIPEATIGPANNFQPQGYGNVEKEWVGNVTWVKASHTLRAGVDFDQQQDNESFLQATFCTFCTGSGGFQFSQGTTQLKGGPAGNDYNAFAAFLLGYPANAGKVTLNPPEYHNYANIFGAYIRDQWHVNSKLTVTLGTRWDYYPFATRGSRGMEYLDAATNRMIICGVAGNPKNCGITKDTQRFEPRGGVAYRVTDTIVLRAGYGLSTDPTFVGGTSGNRQNFPDLSVSTLNAPNSFSYATTLRLGLPVIPAPDYSSGSVPVPTISGVFTVDNHTYSRGYIQSWNVSMEQQFFGSWIGSLGYVATRTIHPFAVLNANWSPIGTGAAGQVLNVLAGRTGITSQPGSEGIGKYDSLQATLSHAFANNFQASAAYTWAHGSGYTTQVAIPAYYSLNYGPLPNVARHSVGLTAVVSSPFGKNQRWMQNGFGAAILGGWQLQGISTLRTGMRFTVTDSNTSLNASGSTQFADCIGTPVKLGKISQWYSTATFAHPAAGRFGTCTTNSLVGPGLVTLDTGVSRTFALKEHLHLEVRALLFNTPNTPHHANPTSSLNSSSFMQALSIANTGRDGIDQRTGQFSARLSW